MHEAEIVIALLAVVAVLAAGAGRAGLPYAPVLVLGGLLLGVVPGLPVVQLDPQLVLLGFIPPLVYTAAFRAASFDLRSAAPQILTLATGLVLLTVIVVAAVGSAVARLPWVSALVLGALAAPTDPVSASSVIRAVGAPEQLLAILEGESLINDGTGLAAFQVAVAAAAGGISLSAGVLQFAGISLGGSAIGIVAGWILVQLRRRLDEPSLEIALGLLAAFAAYVAASVIDVSGVLAAVTAGLYSGSRAQDISSAETRLQIEPFWEALSFLLESSLFLLIGLQVPTIVRGLSGEGVGAAVAQGVVLVAATLAVRCLWMGRAGGRAPPEAAGAATAAHCPRRSRDARRAVSRRRPLHSADRRWPRVPGSRPRHLPDLRDRHRHPGHPQPVSEAPHTPAGTRTGPRAPAGGDPRANPGRPRRPGPVRGAGCPGRRAGRGGQAPPGNP